MRGLKGFHRSKKEFLIIDGAMGSYLEESGCGEDIQHLLWSAKMWQKNPDLIAGVHQEYADAGADIHLTSSYKGFVPFLMKEMELSEEDAVKLLIKSAKLATDIRDK